MIPVTHSSLESALRSHWTAQSNAMVSADSAALNDLLSEAFTLTHMTGYRQPKQEWLADIDSGQMTYHAIDDVQVQVDAASNSLTVRTLTDATIWGSRGSWRLQLTIVFSPEGDDLVATHTVASTW